jgi:phosphoribosylformylglycinamidine synthase
VLEAARNVSCVGGRPLALVNCLNFGNPEHADVMWQFTEVVEGMSEACAALDLPVVGGNVSFYNESLGHDIDPTPVVGLLGLIDELDDRPPPPALVDGCHIVVLGETATELGGSEWAAVVHGLDGGMPPRADLVAGRTLHELVRALVTGGLVDGVHDCSDGGLAIAHGEMAIAGECGFDVTIGSAAECFSESASRVVVAVDPALADDVVARAAAAGVPASDIGVARGDRLVARGAFDISLADATAVWRDAIPNALAADVTTR